MNRYGPRTFALEIVFVVLGVVALFPIYILVTVAFKSPPAVAESTLAPPPELYLDNFITAWTEADLLAALVQTAFITALSVAGLVALGSAAAYGLVRGAGRMHRLLLLFITLGITIPIQLGMVPLYQLMRDLHLLQTPWSVILFSVGSQLPITVFLYSGFLAVQSREYEEAARVDGANGFQTFSRIVFPLLRPITGTVIILSSIHVWNDFLTPLLYLSGSDARTLTVAIFSFRGEFATQWGIVFAGILIAIIPVVTLFFLLQKYVIKGFASGLKG
ncbi:carbohydrate ABC transporter permease [Microbacterium profundi]|uniref:carbohydrate ABC transporter permease n=1 Tax=Microbacterium TaxID=33882 RepID=UPI001F4437ED|nr:carbohydrate ABC transporter permease [Microbacterium profundi]MCE7481542.1 carbohydrate ABC transporter permease [Microbacterium profundi]